MAALRDIIARSHCVAAGVADSLCRRDGGADRAPPLLQCAADLAGGGGSLSFVWVVYLGSMVVDVTHASISAFSSRSNRTDRAPGAPPMCWTGSSMCFASPSCSIGARTSPGSTRTPNSIRCRAGRSSGYYLALPVPAALALVFLLMPGAALGTIHAARRKRVVD